MGSAGISVSTGAGAVPGAEQVASNITDTKIIKANSLILISKFFGLDGELTMRTRSKFPSCEKSKLVVEICRRKLYNIFGVTLIHVSRQGGKAMSVKQMIQFGLVLVVV